MTTLADPKTLDADIAHASAPSPRRRGRRAWIVAGSLLRFRPILMTTFAALLGALPLALGGGTGAELRQPWGSPSWAGGSGWRESTGGLIESVFAGLRSHEVLIAALLVLAPAAYLGALRLVRLVRRRDLRGSDLHALVPFAVGLMGVLNLLSALVPRPPASAAALEHWLPLEVMQRSRPLMLVAGLLLLYLAVYRRRFQARGDPASLKKALLMASVLTVTVLSYGWVGLSRMRAGYAWDPGATQLSEAFDTGIAIVEPHVDPSSAHAARFLGSLQMAGWRGSTC